MWMWFSGTGQTWGKHFKHRFLIFLFFLNFENYATSTSPTSLDFSNLPVSNQRA
jgi:hypothetical protein